MNPFTGTIIRFVEQKCIGYQHEGFDVLSVYRNVAETDSGTKVLYSAARWGEYVGKYYTDCPRIDQWNKAEIVEA